jgi:DNA-binding NarL/FixJ family response regulator
MARIEVLIADDHALVREGIISVLNRYENIAVVGVSENGLDAINKCKTLKPDVLLLDIVMPHINGIETIKLVKVEAPDTRIVALSLYENENYIHQVLKAGASGYVLKASDPSAISTAIQTAYEGDFFFSPEIKKKLVSSFIKDPFPSSELYRYNKLSQQEKKVFQLIVRGKATKSIADKLFISTKTVEKHQSAISRKMGMKNKIEMTHYAIKHGILNIEDLSLDSGFGVEPA